MLERSGGTPFFTTGAPSVLKADLHNGAGLLNVRGHTRPVSGPSEEDDLVGPDLVGIQECSQRAGDRADEATVLRESPG
jgi:hypothetical protein